MNRWNLACAAGAALLAGCAAYQQPQAKASDETLPVNVALTVAPSGDGTYQFRYEGPFFDERGNFDFSKPGALYQTIEITFTLSENSPPELRFKPTAEDAMWIVDKRFVGPDGSPAGPYRGDVFYGFALSEDGRSLRVIDRNDDGVLYRYGLRFDLGAETVIDDPDGQNGGGHG
jgi:hypothetical protein